MKYCPNPDCPHYKDIGTPAEFLDEIDLCSDCGTKLKWGEASAALLDEPEPSPEPAAEPNEDSWVVLATFVDGVQAAAARTRLRAEGIEADIELVVKETDAAVARQILGGASAKAAPEDQD